MPAIYNVNPRKALEVVLWFTEKSKPHPIDFYHILKVLYFADKYHLNTYGRPILGDRYKAMPHGPVAETVYNLLKADGLELQALDECLPGSNGDLPFEVKNHYWVYGHRPCDRRFLSDSDIGALTKAYEEYGSKSFKELERITHDEDSWQNAAAEGTNLKYEDIVEESEKKSRIVEDLHEFSQQAVF